MAASSGSTIAKLFVELGFKGQALTQGSKAAQKDMQRLSGAVNTVNGMIRRATVLAFQAGAAAVAGFGVTAAVTGAKFEQAMTLVGVLSGQTGDALAKMTEQARELGRTTAFTATEAAEGMQALARAGLNTNQIIAASGPAMFYAGANATSMDNATRTLAATLAQFNMNSAESTTIVDTYTAAINNSLLDTTSLTEAMKYAGTTGHAFGMTLQETTAAIGMFRNLGLEGSQAGTNFRMSMISAARATDRKRAVLEEYGLTMADINPQMHTFAEIMDTIGRVGLTSGHAIEVFGARAGANVAVLSGEIHENSERWVQLNAAIADSAGVTETNYATMMDTVTGQWDILKSVFQDMQIEVFEGFGDGLKDLLMALQELVIFTTAVMTESSASMAGSWGNSMSDMAGSIRENKVKIASEIISIINFFVSLGEKILWLITKADTLIPLMAAIFAAGKVWAFIGAINAFTGSMIAATGATTGFAFAINSATAGIPAIIGTIAVFVGTFSMMADSSDDAARAAQRLAEEQQRLAEALDAVNAAATERLSTNTQVQETQLHLLESELAGTDQLTNAIQREIEAVREMDAATLQAGISAGELFEMQLNGEDVVVSTALAMRMAQSENSTYQVRFSAALSSQESSLRGQEQLVQAQVEYWRELLDANEEYSSAMEEYVSWQQGMEAESTQDYYDYAGLDLAGTKLADFWATSETQVSDNVLFYESQWQGAEERRSGFFAEQTRIRLQMERESQQRQIATDRAADEASAASYQRLQDKRRRAAERTAQILRRSIREITEARGHDAAVWRMELEDRIADLNKSFDEEIALWRGHSSKIAEIEENRRMSVRNTRRAAFLDSKSILDDMITEQVATNRALVADETEAIIIGHNEQLAAAEVAKRQMLAVYEEGSRERARAEGRANALIARLRTLQAQELLRIERISAREQVEEINERTRDAQQNHLAEWLQMRLRHQREMEDVQDEHWSVQAAMQRAHNAESRSLERTIHSETRDILRRGLSEEERLRRERGEAILRTMPNQEAERQSIIAFYDARIREARREAWRQQVQDQGFFGALLTRGIKKGGKESVDEVKRWGTMLRLSWDETYERGGGLDPFAPMREAVQGDFMGDVSEKVTGGLGKISGAWQRVLGSNFVQTVKGQTTGPIGKAFGALWFTAEVGVKHFGRAGSIAFRGLQAAAGLLGKAIGAVSKSLKVVGQVAGKAKAGFDKFASGIESISGFSFSLSDAVGAVNEDMETLRAAQEALASGEITSAEFIDQTQGLETNAEDAAKSYVESAVQAAVLQVATFVEAAPVLMKELAAQIPILLDAVAVALPKLVDAVAENIGPIFETIINFIPTVVEIFAGQAPVLLNAILDLVPVLVQTLLDQIPTLIMAVSQIVVALIGSIPTLVQHVVDALPGIIVALFAALDEIIRALVAAIPVVLASVIAALPDIITSLIEGLIGIIVLLVQELPMLLTAIIELIPVLIESIITMIPWIIGAVIEAIPVIVEGLIEAIPMILTAIIESIPLIFEMLIESLPMLVKAFFTQLIPALLLGAAEFAIGVVGALWRFFSDLIREIFTLGKAETETFGDTPGMVKAGTGGMLAKFAPNDYVIAAQRKEDVLNQALRAMGEGIGSATMPRQTATLNVPELQGLGSAVMQSASSKSSSAQPLRVTVTAEGRTLDDVLYVAGNRGDTPKLQKSIRKSSGATLGFSRGRFSSSS